jgi:hypothetical protein
MSTQTGEMMANILTVLRGIRAEDGYRTTVAEVTERKSSFARAARSPALAVASVRERVRHQPAGFVRRVVRILITGFVKPPKGIDKRQAARDLMADVQRALLADPSRGGCAVMTLVRELRFDAMPGEHGCRASCAVDVILHECGA